jgi:hypothetical protein
MVEAKYLGKIMLYSALFFIAIVGLAMFRQGFYLVPSTCQSLSGAQSIATWQESREGFCKGYCYTKQDDYCVKTYGTSKGYYAFCDEGNSAKITFEKRFCTNSGLGTPDECTGNNDCTASESCQYRLGIRECMPLKCDGYTQAVNHECTWIGCRGTGCPTDEYCDWDTNVCEDRTTPVEDIKYGGSLSGLGVKDSVAVGEAINVKGYFTPTESGEYEFSVGIERTGNIQTQTVYATGVTEAVRKQYVTKGQPELLQFKLTGAQESGVYTVSVIVKDPRGDTILNVPFTTQVGEAPVSVDTNNNVVVSGETLCSTEGDVITEDCSDGTKVNAFTCGTECTEGVSLCWVYSESCPEAGGGNNGGSAWCKPYQVLSAAGCQFSFKLAFTNSGLKGLWADFMAYIIGAAIVIIAVIAYLLTYKKKRK